MLLPLGICESHLVHPPVAETRDISVIPELQFQLYETPFQVGFSGEQFKRPFISSEFFARREDTKGTNVCEVYLFPFKRKILISPFFG